MFDYYGFFYNIQHTNYGGEVTLNPPGNFPYEGDRHIVLVVHQGLTQPI